MSSLLENKQLRTAFFACAKPHKRNPYVYSISSKVARDFYRLSKKVICFQETEMEFISLFWNRRPYFSRTNHITKEALWRGQKPEIPLEISLNDFPELPDEVISIFELLVKYYNENSSDDKWNRGYYYSSFYLLALEIITDKTDYLSSIKKVFERNEIWNTNTKSFWNTSWVSVLLNNSKIRNILFSNVVKGFDISNAFPCLLSQALDNNNIPHSYIRSYARDRSSIISSIKETLSSSPLLASASKGGNGDIDKFIKQQLLATLFGRKWGDNDHFFLRGLQKEIEEIKKIHYGGSSTTLSYALYEILGKVQLLAKDFFGSDLVGTVCDCFYIREKSTKTKEDFADYVLDVLEYDLKFEEKL